MPRAANDNFKPRETLSWGTKFLMYSLAAIIDMIGLAFGLLNLIPIAGTVMMFIVNALLYLIGTLTYNLWFAIAVGHKAHGKALAKQPLYKTITGIIELLLGFLPGWSLYVFLSIRDVKKEDALYNKKMNHTPKMLYRTGRAANNNQPRYQQLYNEAA